MLRLIDKFLIGSLVIAVSIGVVILVNSARGVAKERAEYKAKCEAYGGFVIAARDMPRKCMKKEFFIQMEK